MAEDGRKSFLKLALIFLWILIAGVVLPKLGLTIGGGGTLSSYISFVGLFYGFLFAGGAGIVLWYVGKKWFGYDWMGALIYEPEESIAPNFKWFKNPILLILSSIIILSIISYIYIGFGGQGLTQLPPRPLSITGFGSFSLAVEPASTAESLLLIFLTGIGVYLWRYYCKKNNLREEWIWVGILILCILGGLLFSAEHKYNPLYAGQEEAFVGAFLFGFLSLFLSFICGTLIIGILWHEISNAIYYILKGSCANGVCLASVDLTGIVILFIDLLLVLGIIIYLINEKNKSNSKWGGVLS